jgi:hypothetical protein
MLYGVKDPALPARKNRVAIYFCKVLQFERPPARRGAGHSLPDLAEAKERGCGQVRRSVDRLTYRLEGAWEELPAKGKQAFPAVGI